MIFGVILLCSVLIQSPVPCVGDEASVILTKVGEYAVLDCAIEFPHDIVIPHVLEWRKDDKIVFKWADGEMTPADNFVNRIHLLTDKDAWQHGKGSVNITSIRETDEGWYECKVIFPNRTPSTKANGTWYHLQVEGGSLLAVPPINQTVMEEESVKMKCVSKILPANVVWYKDEIPVTEIQNLKDRIIVNPEGSLNIIKTEMKDSGYYFCEITNDDGEKQSAGAYLNVRFKAKVVYAPRRVYLPFGRPGHLECYFKANPEITKIRWEKDGFLFDAYNVPGVFARKNGSLYFSKVDDSHGGEYTCTPYNDLGTNGPSPRMTVIVQRAPVFTVTPHILYLRKIGDTVVMQCDAVDGEGFDKPNLAWRRTNGAEIPHDRALISLGNLTIRNIQESDRGYYQCIATNEAATVSSESELIIQESIRNHAPYNVTTDVSKNSVKVRWLSSLTKPKLKFSVWYRVEDAQEWKTKQLDSKEIFETEISDLNSGQAYEVMVLSQDENGDGMFSKTVKIMTKNHDEEELEAEIETEIDREFRSPVALNMSEKIEINNNGM
ncbi:protein borderless isoform X2 [Planococcus citri]|uniref:protein borderless isoform X2 n=1 Tax=Planococcus citri TaxID=170843 RepID=UPI0031F7611C